MTTPALPREGAWIGGLMNNGFSVRCRSDQAGTMTIEVCKDKTFQTLVGTVTPESVVSGHAFIGTAFVTDLDASREYYWRVKLTDSTTNSITGTEATFTAGSVKTLPTSKSINWRMLGFGCNYASSTTSDTKAAAIERFWRNAINLEPDFHSHCDDVYYSDIGVTNTAAGALGAGSWYARGLTHADAVADGLDGYRTNFINTYAGLSETAGYWASRTKTYSNSMAQFKSMVPGYHMWGDHDRAFNDCSDLPNATGDEATRIDLGRDVGHEMMLRLNTNIIADNGGSFTAYSDSPVYYYIDIPPCRFIYLDCVSYRDDYGSGETSSRTMLGATQLAWLKSAITGNTNKYLGICTGYQLDGNHGWENGPYPDNWKSYSYEREEIFDYIRANGNPARTFFITGDTHELGVFVNRGVDGPPMYSVCAGNSGWTPSAHGFTNGLDGGVAGGGMDSVRQFIDAMGCAMIENKGGKLKISCVSLSEFVAGSWGAPKTLWSKWLD